MRIDVTDHLMTWVLDRPEQSNGFDEVTMTEMDTALCTLEDATENLSCLSIQGHEAVFSTGLDADLLDACFADRAKFTDIVHRMGKLLDRIAELPQITIACVDGDCRLGGLELALACDLIIAGKGAMITDGHLAYDAMPGGGATKRLPSRVGFSGALRFLLESPILNAQQARAIGLVDVAAEGLAAERGAQLASDVSSRNPELMNSLKASLRSACPASTDQSYLDEFQRSVIDRLISD